jgi:hypothetical protein
LDGLNRVLRVSVIQKVKLYMVHMYINISKDSSLTELLIHCKLFTRNTTIIFPTRHNTIELLLSLQCYTSISPVACRACACV